MQKITFDSGAEYYRADEVEAEVKRLEARAAAKTELMNDILATWEAMTNRLIEAEAERDYQMRRVESLQTALNTISAERDELIEWRDAGAEEIEVLQANRDRLTIERDNALSERDRANAGFATLKKEYDKAMTRLAAHGEKVTA